MKPIYEEYYLDRRTLMVTLRLYSHITYGEGEDATIPVSADSLDGLKVELISPKVSGARDLIAAELAHVHDNVVQVELTNLPNALTHTLVLKMCYGTNTCVVYGVKVKTAERYSPLFQPRNYNADVTVVESYA